MITLKVFEHQTIKVDEVLLFYTGGKAEEKILEEKYIHALWNMYDERTCPFFTPTRNGIKFCEWVGVVKVLDLTVEILPKADKNIDFSDQAQQHKWQSILIDMLRVCRSLDTPTASDAPLKLRSNSILDLYIERFIQEVDFLLHSGLIKRYKREEQNSTTLKGKLLLNKHITKNVIHKERFFVVQNNYDYDHLLHRILFKVIKILPRICNNQYLISRSYQLRLNFPEVKDIKIEVTVFDKLMFDRKSQRYRSAIEIAKLILLNLRPDLSTGLINSIAILFDMNQLWEEYIYRMLRKANDGSIIIHNQRSTKFWNQKSTTRYLKPDLIIESFDQQQNKRYIVIDTKWKNIDGEARNISMDDLRQMFAYHHYFDAVSCYLLYPGENFIEEGKFINQSYFDKAQLGNKNCGIIIANAWKNQENKTYLNHDVGHQILKALKLGKTNSELKVL